VPSSRAAQAVLVPPAVQIKREPFRMDTEEAILGTPSPPIGSSDQPMHGGSKRSLPDEAHAELPQAKRVRTE